MELSEWHLWFKQQGGRQLRALLMDKWDPIGVQGVPEATSEYDGYVARIADMLRRGADAEQVAAMLSSIRTDAMGLPPEPDTDIAAATTIVDWYADALRDEAPLDG
jgi:hypothetical protein